MYTFNNTYRSILPEVKFAFLIKDLGSRPNELHRVVWQAGICLLLKHFISNCSNNKIHVSIIL